MEQNPSSEADRHSADKEIPCLSWNLKVHCCVHKSLPRAQQAAFYGDELLAPSQKVAMQPHFTGVLVFSTQVTYLCLQLLNNTRCGISYEILHPDSLIGELPKLCFCNSTLTICHTLY
jgi:hypothetical protein